MTTGTEIYNAALVLIDANLDTDTTEYASKAVSIINVLQGECYPYSRLHTFDNPDPVLITTLTDYLSSLDDYLCQTVLPYGLGAHLLLDENPSTASYLNQRYQELLNERKRGIGNPVNGSEEVIDVYSHNESNGYFPFNRFTRWGGD